MDASCELTLMRIIEIVRLIWEKPLQRPPHLDGMHSVDSSQRTTQYTNFIGVFAKVFRPFNLQLHANTVFYQMNVKAM